MRKGLWTKAQRNDADAAGCLVMMGLLLFLPVVLYSVAKAVSFVWDLVIAIRASGWSEILRVLDAVWEWLRGRRERGTFSPMKVLFLTGYILLFWQWTAFVFNWRPRLSSPRLWAISSAYFVAAMVTFAITTWPASKVPVTIDSNDFGRWLLMTLAFCVVAGGFLCVTLSLWISSRRRTKPAGDPDSNRRPLIGP